MNDKSNLEFFKWMQAVSKAIGVAPPTSLEETAETSLTPVLSKLRENEARVSALESSFQSLRKSNQELLRKVDDLERS